MYIKYLHSMNLEGVYLISISVSDYTKYRNIENAYDKNVYCFLVEIARSTFQ